jgi:hypothetical protein
LAALLLASAERAEGQALVLPGSRPPTPIGEQQRSVKERRAPPAAARAPNKARAAADKSGLAQTIVGAPLFHDGRSGRLVIERGSGNQLLARLRVEGRQIANPTAACAVELGMAEPVALVWLGAPRGLPRYQLAAPICPIVFEVLQDAVLVPDPEATCRFAAADCEARVGGLWGPMPPALIAHAKEIERQRSRHERSLRDDFRTLLRRLSGNAQREAAAEQAGFSSDREMLCRGYESEVEHGFCAERVTAARVTAVKALLAVTPLPKKTTRP